MHRDRYRSRCMKYSPERLLIRELADEVCSVCLCTLLLQAGCACVYVYPSTAITEQKHFKYSRLRSPLDPTTVVEHSELTALMFRHGFQARNFSRTPV